MAVVRISHYGQRLGLRTAGSAVGTACTPRLSTREQTVGRCGAVWARVPGRGRRVGGLVSFPIDVIRYSDRNIREERVYPGAHCKHVMAGEPRQ